MASIGRSGADTTRTVIDPQTGQKVVVDAALADQINLRRDGKRIDAEIAAGIRNPDGSLRDGGATGGSVTVVDTSGRPPGDYLDPDRADTFSRSINEYWRQGFEATDAAHLASVGHEYTDAPELRQAYADRDAYLAKLDAYATQMVDKPIGLALGAVVVTAATAGTGTVAAGYLGLTGWGAFGAGVVTDGVAAGNGGLFYHPLVGERNSVGSYGRDVLSGAAGSGALRVLGKGAAWGIGKFGSSGSIVAESVPGRVTAFRVEGTPNARFGIDDLGNVALEPGDKTIWLNFGQEGRAMSYLDRKVADGLPGAHLKSFDVDPRFLDEIRATAVPENLARRSPGAPIISRDPFPDQYGLRPDQFQRLMESVYQGSGKYVRPR